MPGRRFHPTPRFSLTIIVPSLAIGVGLAMFDDWRSRPGFGLSSAAGAAVFACALLVVPCYFIARWYGKVLIDPTGVSARDTLGRWRTIPWDSLSAVRRLRLLGLPFILLSSTESRWSLWLAGSLAPREALLRALSDVGPRAAAIRAQFTSAA